MLVMYCVNLIVPDVKPATGWLAVKADFTPVKETKTDYKKLRGGVEI